MEEEIKPKKFPWLVLAASFFAVALAATGAVYYFSRVRVADSAPVRAATEAPAPPIHRPAPAEVRGMYLVSGVAGNENKFNALAALGKARGINSLVVDLKNFGGTLAFSPATEVLQAETGKSMPLGDLTAFAAKVHGDGFYLIGRIPVFEDPNYADRHPALALKLASGKLWTDRSGLAWLDPAAEDVWKYNATIASEAYAAGFDEIQFDYVRFATDGATSAIVFPVYNKKETYRQVIGRFFAYLNSTLGAKGVPISADVFGFVTWHQNDLGIGQWYDDAIRTMNYVSPMVYPSHYPTGVLKFKNPADHPYEIISDSLKKGNEVIAAAAAETPPPALATQRPWLQAFDLGAKYTPAMIAAEVKAARDNGASGFMFWNASNNYDNLPDLSVPLNPKP